jgi:hypothetical protein
VSSTLIFVHGTGVRRDKTQDLIRNGLRDAGRNDVTVKGVDWGDQLGVKLSPKDLADVLPEPSRAIDEQEDLEAALWALLLEDPLFELRMIAVEPRGASTSIANALPGLQPAEVMVAERLITLSVEGAPGGIDGRDIGKAASDLAAQPALLEAVRIVGDPNDPDLLAAVARAVSATALVRSRAGIGEGPDALFLGVARAELVTSVTAAISTETRGLGGWLLGKVKDFALAKATQIGRERRTGLMQAASPGIGDILLYQRRGAEIRAYVRAAILGEPKETPLVVLGHSLGGIILFDLLNAGNLDHKIACFITIGSQSAFFYKCEALESRRLGDGQAPFTPWFNVYDRNDLLSFRAGPAFGGPRGVEDLQVASGAPFPDSHGAYFRMMEVHREIAKRCP